MSMYTPHAELKAGIIVVLALGVLLGFLFFAGGSEPFWQDYRYVYLRFEPGFIAPKKGDEVVMNGVIVGRIDEVALQEEIRSGEGLSAEDRKRAGESGKVREIYVRAIVKMPAWRIVPRGTSGQIDRTLTGQRNLALLPGYSLENLTDEDIRKRPIIVRQAPGLAQISQMLSGLVTKLEGFIGDGSVLLGEIQSLVVTLRGKIEQVDVKELNAELRGAVAALTRTLDTIQARVDTIGVQLEGAARDIKGITEKGGGIAEMVQQDLKEILADLEKVVRGVQGIVERAGPRIDAALASFEKMAASMEGIGEQFRGIGPDARNLLADVGLEVGEILENLQDMSQSLMDAGEEIRARPWLLFNEPERPGEHAFANLRATSQAYVRAMRDVEDAQNQVLKLLRRDDLDGEEVKAMMRDAKAAYASSLERYRQVEARFHQLLREAPAQRPR